jgi:Glycine-zipper domain
MSKRLLTVQLLAIFVLAGCVTAPVGPSVFVLPGSQKSLDQFRVDDAACRQYAAAVLGGAGAAQQANDAAAANAVAGALIGATAGAIIGSASGQASQGAAVGAGTGLLFGSAAGSNVSGYSSYALQANYDAAYVQCMYTRGNQVPGRAVYRRPPQNYPAPAGSYPPPNYPPPNYPPPGEPAGSYPPPNYPPPGYPPQNTPPPR